MSVAPSQLGRPVGADGEQTRARIITAAMRCVAEMGYSRTTIREIARAADMTSASLYNYFPNKAELIKAAIAARTDVALPRLRAAAAGAGTAIDRIEAVLDESGRLMREYPDLAAFEWVIRAEGVADVDARL
ncbi:TetR/AcrR family transcriptional regulator, partial [Mycobacterium sp. 852002-30065_SCH5024008]|uniref:TetR/AcrR family transcriptional regulator n=1 Tax=Mycobacterium sp. 852002-30065_SCH5024008 TaxID=1834088 RepID=UPI0012E74AEB